MTPTPTPEALRQCVEALEGWIDRPEDTATYDAAMDRAMRAIAVGRAALAAQSALTPAEAIYGFAAWLTTNPGRVVLGHDADCASIVPLVERYRTGQGWPAPREDYHQRLASVAHPEPAQSTPAEPQPIDPPANLSIRRSEWKALPPEAQGVMAEAADRHQWDDYRRRQAEARERLGDVLLGAGAAEPQPDPRMERAQRVMDERFRSAVEPQPAPAGEPAPDLLAAATQAAEVMERAKKLLRAAGFVMEGEGTIAKPYGEALDALRAALTAKPVAPAGEPVDERETFRRWTRTDCPLRYDELGPASIGWMARAALAQPPAAPADPGAALQGGAGADALAARLAAGMGAALAAPAQAPSDADLLALAKPWLAPDGQANDSDVLAIVKAALARYGRAQAALPAGWRIERSTTCRFPAVDLTAPDGDQLQVVAPEEDGEDKVEGMLYRLADALLTAGEAVQPKDES